MLKGYDAVVNALPYHLAIPAAHWAQQAGCHYFDLTEDVAATREIMRIAAGAKTAFMPQCGLAPGFISIVASPSLRCVRSTDSDVMCPCKSAARAGGRAQCARGRRRAKKKKNKKRSRGAARRRARAGAAARARDAPGSSSSIFAST